ncbi:TetR/AcrR family transcriptional regulator [soil metagenome]
MHTQTETIDRRVVRTIASLRAALIELILEKHYDSITVQDVIDRANVGRSTFYTHFRDKEDLLIGDWKKFLSMIAAHIELNSARGGRLVPIEGLMMHLKDYHALSRALVKSGKSERLFDLGTEFLADAIEKKIVADTRSTSMTVPPAVCAHFLSLQIFGLLKWWLDRNMPYSPTEMDAMFHSLIGPGIRNVLEGRRTITKSDADLAKDSYAEVHANN